MFIYFHKNTCIAYMYIYFHYGLILYYVHVYTECSRGRGCLEGEKHQENRRELKQGRAAYPRISTASVAL